MFLPKVLPIITESLTETQPTPVAHIQYHAHTESEPKWVDLVGLSLSGWLVRLLVLF